MHKKVMILFYGISLRLTFLGSKSSQSASIFHKKNYGGVKKYFFGFLPPYNSIFKVFLHHFVGLIQKDPTLGFWVKAFQNQYIFL